MPIVLGFILLGTFVLTAVIAESEPTFETKRLTGRKRKIRRQK